MKSLILLMLLCMIGMVSAFERRVYILPATYVGPVVIVYDVEGGTTTEQSGGATVFRIPSSGVLVLKNKPPDGGLVASQYYYAMPDGGRLRIPYNVDDKKVLQVFASEYGHTSVLGGRKIDKRWISFIVGTPDSDAEWGVARQRLVRKALMPFTKEH